MAMATAGELVAFFRIEEGGWQSPSLNEEGDHQSPSLDLKNPAITFFDSPMTGDFKCIF